jgi:hypothetical protein
LGAGTTIMRLFIVRLLVPFGMFSLVDLGCIGLCLNE